VSPRTHQTANLQLKIGNSQLSIVHVVLRQHCFCEAVTHAYPQAIAR
jgi:hypothetical protein